MERSLFIGSGPLGFRFDRALARAAEWHRGQLRKSGNVPYLSHLLRVAGLALDYGASEDVAVAALLHDAVEDCGGLETLAIVRAEFGDDVAKIVEETSDSAGKIGEKKVPWEERKRAYLARLKTGSIEAALVSGCDKIDNAASFVRALDFNEERTFLAKFSREPKKIVWYYESVAEILTERRLPVAKELNDVVERLAVRLASFRG